MKAPPDAYHSRTVAASMPGISRKISYQRINSPRISEFDIRQRGAARPHLLNPPAGTSLLLPPLRLARTLAA
jgi:hypothetical protein